MRLAQRSFSTLLTSISCGSGAKRSYSVADGGWIRAENTKRDELEVIRKADATIVVSEAEQALLTELVPKASVFHIGLPIELPLPENLVLECEARHRLPRWIQSSAKLRRCALFCSRGVATPTRTWVS